jgi:uncharacterized protein YjbI with pentapeptide repeats
MIKRTLPLLLLAALASPAAATVTNWMTGQVITTKTIGPGADFSSMNLEYADFRNKNLVGVNFGLSDLSHADLAGATLSGQGFVSYNANFFNANLTGANFSWVNQNALVIQGHMSFQEANLTNTSFAYATLFGSDFTGATLNNTDFTGAELDGVLGLTGTVTPATIIVPESPYVTIVGFLVGLGILMVSTRSRRKP